MIWISLCLLARGAFAVTQPTGISQFWTDDYKVFEQIYGKTSDRGLYDANLAAGHATFPRDDAAATASDKTERHRYAEDARPSALPTAKYSDTYGDKYDDNKYAGALLAEQQYILKHLSDAKPTKPTYKFVGFNDHKPISLASSPDAYNYLKHLEQLQQQQPLGFPRDGKGFKPYTKYAVNTGYVASPSFGPTNPSFPSAGASFGAASASFGPSSPTFTNPESSDAYRSIQDILDAHEANKSKGRKYKEADGGRYVTYESKPKKVSSRYVQSNDIGKTARCGSAGGAGGAGGAGRCRKRAPHPTRPRPRAIVRKIKHTFISD